MFLANWVELCRVGRHAFGLGRLIATVRGCSRMTHQTEMRMKNFMFSFFEFTKTMISAFDCNAQIGVEPDYCKGMFVTGLQIMYLHE